MTCRIEVFEFQPFASRQGIDTVYGLRFRFDPAVTWALKEFNRAHKADVFDPERSVFAAGGWQPHYGCWFVEKPLLEKLRHHLAGLADLVVTNQRLGV